MAFKIAYGAGHNRYTPGKRLPRELDPNETREWVLNDQVADAFAEAAAQYEDVEILRVDDPTGETDIDLFDRCRKANEWGADFFLAIHHDSASKVFDGGGVSAHIIGTGGTAEEYQKAIYDAVIAAGGIKGNRSAPLQVSNFYVLRKTDAPAVLMEYGFMDSRVDAPIILDPAYSRKVAFGTMEGIARVAGLQKKFSSGWQWIDDAWYYLDDSGDKQTGWQWIDGHWFYLNSNGEMQKGWQWLDGYWFYLDSSGHMLTGWQWIDSHWFYLDGSGHMLKGWQWIDSHWFYLDGSGHMLKGWQWIDSHWFYLNNHGEMQKGWQWIDSHWYYFYNNGAMATDVTIDGYKIGHDGVGTYDNN